MFVNLTPHEIHLPIGIVSPSGVVARCDEVSEQCGEVEGVPIISRRYGEVRGLPSNKMGVWLIVSHMCRVACPERRDLLSPGDLTRDEKGQITGCTNLVVNMDRERMR